ncbi:izumo sperm-egg fusion protein 3 isoform X2 [Rhinatrema bivittatum]|uniref:izumo sperm-egg fusion protein 3 isoform X2 n=1 Tax=Rhinatrema bivittatum TaxID=194408 RepID=UPI00112C8093|nr:izumo sperm-egg fusion protein 3 isoform X2 [Rhinatrema bivittatum]
MVSSMALSLWVLALLVLSSPGAPSELNVTGLFGCDRKFVRVLDQLLGEMVPPSAPGREALLASQLESLLDLYAISFKKKYQRILDVRSVMALKSQLTSKLQDMKKEIWKGVNIFQMHMINIRNSMKELMKSSIEKFINLAVIEGPVLDCWSCLRVRAQCFDGAVCGESDALEAEKKEVHLYLFFVCEAVALASALLLYYFCVLHRRRMLETLGHSQ